MKLKHFLYIMLIITAIALAFMGCSGGSSIETLPNEGGGGTEGGNGGDDLTQPYILKLLPADDATGVATNTNLFIKFNEIVYTGSGNISIFDSSDTLIEAVDAGSVQVTGSGTDTITVSLSGTLLATTDYYIKIDPFVFKDASDNNFSGILDNTTWNFQTGAGDDLTAPLISTCVPAVGAIDVPLNTNLVITFDEIVVAGNGNISIYDSLDNLIEAIDIGSGQITGFWTETITVDPTSNFTEFTDYYITIDATAIKDTAGNYFAGITAGSWSFTTGTVPDLTPPSIQTLSPPDDDTTVVPSSNLVIDFNEEVVSGAGNITIYDSADNLFEAIDVSSDKITGLGTTTITINPTSDLEELVSYYVLIDPGTFIDAANNDFAGIIDSTSWNFTTVDVTPPSIQKLYPSDNSTGVDLNTNLIMEFSEKVFAVAGKNIYIYYKIGVDPTLVETIDATSINVTGSGTKIITIDPTADFTETSTNYYIQIDAGAFQDASYNNFAGIADVVTWNFQTGISTDSVSPTTDINTNIPAAGAVDIPLNTNIVIIFTEPVFSGAGNVTIIESGAGTFESVPASSVSGLGTDTIAVDPANDLDPSKNYQVQIDADAFQDVAGNYFAGISDTSWNFDTGSSTDTTKPSIVDLSPADEDTYVLLVSNLIITFDEEVLEGNGNISIYDSADTLLEAIDVNSGKVTGFGTDTIIINPLNDFGSQAEYYVLIDAGAFKDISNNDFEGITDSTTWNFTTEIGVLLTDSFDYGGTAGDLDTISGTWSEVVSSTAQKVQYDSNGITGFLPYATGTGGKATAQNDLNGGAVGRGFTEGAITNDGAIYFGFIVSGPLTTNNTDAGPGVLFYNGTTALGGISFMGKITGTEDKYEVILDAGGSSTTVLKNTTSGEHLILIRYDFVNNTLDGWFDPDVSLAETAPNVTLDLSGSPWTNIDSVAIDQSWRGIVSPSNTFGIDEIKVTKSWFLLKE